MTRARESGAPGKPVPRKEDARLVTGAGVFIEDLRLRGTLHVAILRSPHAHARLARIDTAAARAAPGVAGVFTLADVKDHCDLLASPLPPGEAGKIPRRHPLAGEEITFAGEPLAAVAAETREAARDALDLIEADYQPLSAVVDAEKALLADAPRAHSSFPDNVAFRWRAEGGDVDGAFARADRVVRQRFVLPRILAYPLETRGVVAVHAPADGMWTVWTSAESPRLVRSRLATALRVPEPAIRVVTPQVGGSFGAKLDGRAEEALLAVLAKLLAPRPVQWIETRGEHLLAAAHGRGQVWDLAVAARRDGRILAIQCEAIADLGAHPEELTPLIPALAGLLTTGAYQVPAARAGVTGVFTNKTATGACRDGGGAEAAYLIERAMDLVARELELDPLALRRLHFVRSFPHRTPLGAILHGADYARALDRLLELAEHASLKVEVENRRARGELVGIGIATCAAATAPGALAGSGWEAAAVSVGPGGTVEVHAGIAATGEGPETVLAQIAAAKLGVPVADVRVHLGDTGLFPGGGGGGNGLLEAAGAAVHLAAAEVERQLRRVAAHFLKSAEDYVERAAGGFIAGDRSAGFAEVCAHAHRASELPGDLAPGLMAVASSAPPAPSSSFSAHLCVAAVDRETGEVRIERHFAAGEGGHAVHALVAEGQAHGGIARGIGEALHEEAVFDGAGRLLAGGLADYAVPKASQLPQFLAGDAGAIGAAPAAANAVLDALHALGVRHLDLPLTPEKVWRALREANGGDPRSV